jgi:hypothetical protein
MKHSHFFSVFLFPYKSTFSFLQIQITELNFFHLFAVCFLAVLLFHPDDGTEGFPCGIGVCSSIASKYGLYIFFFNLFLLVNPICKIGLHILNPYNMLRLSLVRRLLHQNSQFLISQSKYVMQFRRELKKVGLPFLVHVL